MNKIVWCLKQKKGIRMIPPSEIISQEYIKDADEDLKTMLI